MAETPRVLQKNTEEVRIRDYWGICFIDLKKAKKLALHWFDNGLQFYQFFRQDDFNFE